MVSLDDDFRPSPLWSFSLEHYAKAGVKQACLALQDEHGLDVNVALACLWHERRGAPPLSEADIGKLLAVVGRQQARVRAIRPLRREAKGVDLGDGLYRTLKRAELLAENLLQRALHEALADWPPGPPGDGRASLRAYAAHHEKTLPPEQVEAFSVR